MIRIQGLHKFFNKGRQNEIHVINDVSMDLPEKGMVAIFGKSGCGKTTLLNVIGGLDGFAEGKLTIENQSITENTDVIRNRYVGYIFQNYNLNKEESCFDNVANALRLCGMTDGEEMERRVMAALENVGMEKYGKRTPDTLSGGQQQRIAIARAIVKNPRIILADEPTGNLDEANTVMIMNLLKAISRDHLVLIVTHEANLVDYYCDSVIELKDGKVVSTKQNTSANGFSARNKNDVYLGELARSEIAGDNAVVEYYGEAPESPVRLKIVNHGGKIYVQVGTEKVQIIDEFSEVKLRDGVYNERPNDMGEDSKIDMTRLPPVTGSKHGKLFSLRSSIKSGYTSNFKGLKRGKKMLIGCMCLFSAVIVLMSASFGTAFKEIIDVRKAYNHNVFYVYTPSAEISAKLNDAVGKENTGIDYVRLNASYPYGDSNIGFRTGTFETFSVYSWESTFSTNAVFLDLSLARGKRLVAGKMDGLSFDEVLITTQVADALLKKSAFGYIREYADLVGFISDSVVNGKGLRIAGIVEGNETAVYLTEITMARMALENASLYVSLASDYGINVAPGEACLYINRPIDGVSYPLVGDTVKIQGNDLTVAKIKEYTSSYDKWLEHNGIKKRSDDEFASDIVRAEKPAINEASAEFKQAVKEAKDTHLYDYYDYLYAEFDEFYKELYFFQPTQIEPWLYFEKGVAVARYYGKLPDDYYKAICYKAKNGSYPSKLQMSSIASSLPSVDDELMRYVSIYENEFYGVDHIAPVYYSTYMVSDEDYVAFSKKMGESHASALANTRFKEDEIAPESGTDFVVDLEKLYKGEAYYTVIHSTDANVTEAWLKAQFPLIAVDTNDEWKPMITPKMMFKSLIYNRLVGIITGLITLAITFALMSCCMYFIMRSSLMGRIKEVGIYRAIGVSKSNLLFKFFIEAVVLTTLTVLVGFLISSAFVFVSFGMSSLVAEIFFYPLWMAVIVLVVLYAICLFFGTFPIMLLLRKTPSEILAKYDI